MERARDGDFNLMNRISSAFARRGFRVEFMPDSRQQRLKSAVRRGYSLFFMAEPFHRRALTLRRAYFYPYWRIENTARRWKFTVAEKTFDPAETKADMARDWADRWRRWLFAGKARAPRREGVVYVPLQGRLRAHRSFQERSPLDMVREVLERDRTRNIFLGLHPKERYSDTDMAALETLCARNPRLRVQTGRMAEALRVCDYVVTENSSAALFGWFFHKPAILFAKTDFHHIGLNVTDMGAGAAFGRVGGHRPDYDRYLHWFIEQNAIKADAPEAEDRIIAAVRRQGWEV